MAKSKRRSPILTAVWLAALVYLGMVLMLTGCQKRLIYYPGTAAEDQLIERGGRMGLEPWRDAEQQLIGWKAPAPAGEGTPSLAVVFHGNAGMAVDRVYYPMGLQRPAGERRWDVYLFEYPGYGARPGSPGEKTFYEAARAGLENLLAEHDGTLFLVGESLGSGVAARMAAEFPDEIDGVLLVTPFTTLPDVGARHFRWLPVRLLLRERYDNEAALKEYGGPVAIILAEHDEVIPVDLGQRLYDGYEGPKKLWIQEGRTHNTLDLSPGAAWWDELAAFLEEEAR